MRIPFPERITPWHAGCFAAILCTFELLQGTDPLFVLCVFAYIMMATVAFNLAGGLFRPSGAYVMANAVLCLILAQCAKVVLGEPADSNLHDPITTILVLTGGMASILFAVVVSRRLIPRMALLEHGDVIEDNRQIAIGCIAVGMVMPFLVGLIGSNEPGSFSSALNQFSLFLPLGIVLATYDEIRSSRGRRSINVFVLLGGLYVIGFWGILGTSKQGLFIPLVSYSVVCGALRYRFRFAGIVGMALAGFVMLYYLVPFSQVVRNYTRTISDVGERLDASIYWLENIDEVRAEYNKDNDSIALSAGPHYYNEDRGFLERLSMMDMDDALIDVADHGTKFGYSSMIVAIENLVPHFIWADKPSTNFANVYGHEVGLLGDQDNETSISFGPSADGYFMGGWTGVLLVMPIVLTLMFIVVDSVAGDIRKTPWGLVYTVFFFHSAPESSLGGCIGTSAQTTIILLITVYTARYVLPLVGNLFFPERRKSVLMRKVREFPKTVAPPPAEIAG
jgi:hypothetical protein